MAKSKPTAIKFGTHGHKVVGELSLKDQRPIWSQSKRNQRRTKKIGFHTLEQEPPRSNSSWEIGWFFFGRKIQLTS